VTTATTNKLVSYSTGGGGGGGGGNGGFSGSCSGYNTTHVLVLPWGGSGLTANATNGSWKPNDAVVVQFTTGSLTTTQTNLGNIGAAQYVDPDASRYGALSTTPCDFTVGLPLRKCAGTYSIFASNVAPSIGMSMIDSGSCVALLQPNTTYYFNMTTVNPATGQTACTTATCNMMVNLTKPKGT
jgi:hypothetical protein